MTQVATPSAASQLDQRARVNRLPRATYRFQLRTDFGFADLAKLIPYLHRLGISDLYLSPLFHAREDSQHGYDVVDHNRIEPAFGDLDSLRELSMVARQLGMGLLLDIVPNHMGINDPDNLYWNDVLENGPHAKYADFFDIDWDPPGSTFPNRVLLPFLGKHFGATLESGELQVRRDGDGFSLAYFDRRFPLTPHSWPAFLTIAVERLDESAGQDARDELHSIIYQLQALPLGAGDTDGRYREQAIARRRLHQLQQSSASVRRAIDASLQQINGDPDDPRSFDALEAVLNGQYYRLAFWQVAADEINYRRFFDINDLAAIRVEEPQAFEAVHRLTFELLKAGIVTGLRIDHPDGLLDPSDYFKQLQTVFQRSCDDHDGRSLYVVAEKILSGDEPLPPSWAISGTTGYEFLNQVSGVLVNPSGVEHLQQFYGELHGTDPHPRDVSYEGKRTILGDAMASELFVLASRLFRVARSDRRSYDFTLPVLSRALQEWIACFSVYRTYIRPTGWEVASDDHGRIREATRWAKIRNPTMSWAALDFLERILLLQFPPDLSPELQAQWRQLAVRLQQVTGPVTAKGIEDTAFYRYFPLASLNEVGAELGAEGSDPDAFHRQMQRRATDWPRALSTTATHDTKRGEDVRARLHVLSEMPQRYADAFRSWEQENQNYLQIVHGRATPDINARYLIHQTLLGTWPIAKTGAAVSDALRQEYSERMLAYFQKALREAKMHTSWRTPNEEYEQAVREFVATLLADPNSSRYKAIDALARAIAAPGYVNSLSQVVLKATLPGVPDFYQGNEFWDFHLVDPDNRRPVDYQTRQTTLDQIETAGDSDTVSLVKRLRNEWSDDLKLFTTRAVLRMRRHHWPLCASGDYIPLGVRGKFADHVLAFARRYQQQSMIVIVPRLPLGMHPGGDRQLTLNDFIGEIWADTAVECPETPSQLIEQFTGRHHSPQGGTLQLAKVMNEFCYCILTNQGSA